MEASAKISWFRGVPFDMIPTDSWTIDSPLCPSIYGSIRFACSSLKLAGFGLFSIGTWAVYVMYDFIRSMTDCSPVSPVALPDGMAYRCQLCGPEIPICQACVPDPQFIAETENGFIPICCVWSAPAMVVRDRVAFSAYHPAPALKLV
jgi:hypothetical protein